jgi:hypothetical protein
LNSKALQKPKVLEYYQRIEKKERNKTRLKKNSEQKCSRSHFRSEFWYPAIEFTKTQSVGILSEKKERNKTRLKKNSEQKCALALIFALNFGTRDRNRTDTAAMATGF